MKVHIVINDAINVMNAYHGTGCVIAPQRRTVELTLSLSQMQRIGLKPDEMIESVSLINLPIHNTKQPPAQPDKT